MAGWLGQAGWLACYPGLCLQGAGGAEAEAALGCAPL